MIGDVILNEGVNALAAIPAVASLNGVMMVAQMNGGLLSGVIAVDVEYFGMAWWKMTHGIKAYKR